MAGVVLMVAVPVEVNCAVPTRPVSTQPAVLAASQKVIEPAVSGAALFIAETVKVTGAGEATDVAETVSVNCAGFAASAAIGKAKAAAATAVINRGEAMRLQAEKVTFNMPEVLGSHYVVKRIVYQACQ